MLDIPLLHALHAVHEHGSLSGAAETLHITTSAVSQRITKLERETGQRMIERLGRGVRLTDAAVLLVGYADRILSLVNEAEATLDGHRGAIAGRLSIAGFSTAVRGLLPPAIVALRERHPSLRLEVCEHEPDVSLPRLVRGDVDIAVVQDWFNAPLDLPDGLMKAPLLDDVADVALPAGHPLAQRHTLELDELAGENWITWTPGSVCHDWLMQTLRARGVEPRVVHTAADYSTQLALVASGLGICVIPRLGRDMVPPGVAVSGVRPLLSRHVYAVWRRESARRPAIRAAVDALVTTALPTELDYSTKTSFPAEEPVSSI
ncbi:LysR family transcriptional regulator [Actinomadura hibisca]|uniref:LysR family transcriptional regulator n=1 Tax=Actinomadura hibisca TaxID=68565 RepID=UPI0009FEF704|nr:LysR family transcriptional regulator [Actinomadura hibisca]